MIKKLSELNPNDEGIIVNIVGKGQLIRRLADMGLVRNTKIKVIRKAPIGDPIEFEVKGYNLSLRKEEAERIYVEVKDKLDEDAHNLFCGSCDHCKGFLHFGGVLK